MPRALALLLAPLALSACTHLVQVEQGIRARRLAGGWRSERGDSLLIGCSGAFSADLQAFSLEVTGASHESGSHLTELDAHGFTVSRFPLPSDHYDVAEWPHAGKAGIEARIVGMRWVRTRQLDCD